MRLKRPNAFTDLNTNIASVISPGKLVGVIAIPMPNTYKNPHYREEYHQQK